VFTGEKAKARIAQGNLPTTDGRQRATPASAHDFYLYDGGTFNGSITYWAFSCDSVENCWSAVLSLSDLTRDDFQPWQPSRYAVVMNGPGFYAPILQTDHWDVSKIRSGVCFELVRGDHESMRYFAIDFDRKRVFGHFESGGFRPTLAAGAGGVAASVPVGNAPQVSPK
jgi:hypothetical protein